MIGRERDVVCVCDSLYYSCSNPLDLLLDIPLYTTIFGNGVTFFRCLGVVRPSLLRPLNYVVVVRKDRTEDNHLCPGLDPYVKFLRERHGTPGVRKMGLGSGLVWVNFDLPFRRTTLKRPVSPSDSLISRLTILLFIL